MVGEQRPIRLSGHLPGLDGVRGVAILLVMAVHFVGGATPHNLAERIAVKAGSFGVLGVDLFFVLSGFLITGLLLDAKGGPSYFRNFYARRTLRIFPLYYMVLALLFVVLPRVTVIPDSLEYARQHEGWLWTYTTNFFLAAKASWALGYVSHFWSLAIEEHFYLVWPLIVFSFRRETLEKICVGVLAAGLIGRSVLAVSGMSELSISVLTPCRVDTLCVGALLATVARRAAGPEPLVRRAALGAVAMAAGIFVVSIWCVVTGIGLPVMHQVRNTFYALFFGALTLLAVQPAERAWTARLFQNRTLRMFGKYSYGLYVYHGIISHHLFEHRVEDRLGAMLGSHSLGIAVQAAIGVSLSLLVSVASYELFEKRFLALKRFFEGARPVPASGAVPAVATSAGHTGQAA